MFNESAASSLLENESLLIKVEVLLNYLVACVLQVKRENTEREALGALPLYQRTIP